MKKKVNFFYVMLLLLLLFSACTTTDDNNRLPVDESKTAVTQPPTPTLAPGAYAYRAAETSNQGIGAIVARQSQARLDTAFGEYSYWYTDLLNHSDELVSISKVELLETEEVKSDSSHTRYNYKISGKITMTNSNGQTKDFDYVANCDCYYYENSAYNVNHGWIRWVEVKGQKFY